MNPRTDVPTTRRQPALLGMLALGLLASCASKPAPEQPVAPVRPQLYEWHGDKLTGPVAVEIILSEQKALFTVGGHDAGWSYLATGKEGYNTPVGKFRITEKIKDKRSNRWGSIVNAQGNVVDGDARAGREPVPPGGRFVGAPMPHWMRLTNYGIGLHAGYIPNPGLPASHGCIRMPDEMAEILFHSVKVGTPVTIMKHAPAGGRAAQPAPASDSDADETPPQPLTQRQEKAEKVQPPVQQLAPQKVDYTLLNGMIPPPPPLPRSVISNLR